MAKILKVAAVVIAVAAITIATQGAGTGPALSVTLPATGATIGIGAAASATVFGLGAGALTAIGAGLSVVSGLLAKKPVAGSYIGSPTDWKSDTGAPLPYHIGRVQEAGTIQWRLAT